MTFLVYHLHLLDEIAVDEHEALLHEQVGTVSDEYPLPLLHQSIETPHITGSVRVTLHRR